MRAWYIGARIRRGETRFDEGGGEMEGEEREGEGREEQKVRKKRMNV